MSSGGGAAAGIARCGSSVTVAEAEAEAGSKPEGELPLPRDISFLHHSEYRYTTAASKPEGEYRYGSCEDPPLHHSMEGYTGSEGPEVEDSRGVYFAAAIIVAPHGDDSHAAAARAKRSAEAEKKAEEEGWY